MATDYDCWKDSEDRVSVAGVMAVFKRNISKVTEILVKAVELVGREDWDQDIDDLKVHPLTNYIFSKSEILRDIVMFFFFFFQKVIDGGNVSSRNWRLFFVTRRCCIPEDSTKIACIATVIKQRRTRDLFISCPIRLSVSSVPPPHYSRLTI